MVNKDVCINLEDNVACFPKLFHCLLGELVRICGRNLLVKTRGMGYCRIKIA